jgi:hypothetical protein
MRPEGIRHVMLIKCTMSIMLTTSPSVVNGIYNFPTGAIVPDSAGSAGVPPWLHVTIWGGAPGGLDQQETAPSLRAVERRTPGP